jgi:hypothetical protein
MGKISGAVKATSKTAKWAAPILRGVNLNKQVDQALKRKDIQKELENYPEDVTNFREKLKEYINYENIKNSRLEKIAKTIDTGNKALVPVDATLDAFNILGGVGYAARGLVSLAKLPAYIAYNTYYLGKTGDVKGAVKNVGYELASWLSPGSLPHLLNYYTRQAEKYAVKEGSKKFLKSLRKRRKRRMPKKSLEEVAVAA